MTRSRASKGGRKTKALQKGIFTPQYQANKQVQLERTIQARAEHLGVKYVKLKNKNADRKNRATINRQFRQSVKKTTGRSVSELRDGKRGFDLDPDTIPGRKGSTLVSRISSLIGIFYASWGPETVDTADLNIPTMNQLIKRWQKGERIDIKGIECYDRIARGVIQRLLGEQRYISTGYVADPEQAIERKLDELRGLPSWYYLFVIESRKTWKNTDVRKVRDEA